MNASNVLQTRPSSATMSATHWDWQRELADLEAGLERLAERLTGGEPRAASAR